MRVSLASLLGILLLAGGCEVFVEPPAAPPPPPPEADPAAELTGECATGDLIACRARCKEGDAAGCFTLGDRLARGDGVPKDPRSAVRFLGLACDGWHADACAVLAWMLNTDAAGRPDFPRAARAAEQACKGSSAAGCYVLARMTAQGRGVPRDEERARSLFRASCEAGYKESCRVLAAREDR